MIGDYPIGKWIDFTEPDEAVLCLDSCLSHPNLNVISDYEISNKIEYLSFIVPYVAKAFEIDRMKLLDEWVKEYGIWEIVKLLDDFSTNR